MSQPRVVLITGANRGIGKGLATIYLAQSNTTVVATVRSVGSAASLETISKATGSRLIVIELDLGANDSIQKAANVLREKHGINALDILIANAGIAGVTPNLTDIKREELQSYIDVNAYAQLELYKAFLPLLKASQGTKNRFVYISSAGGSLTTMNNIVPLAAYGASKAYGNFLFKWLALEGGNDVLIWCQHPGMVATEMGSVGFDELAKKGTDLRPYVISVEQCVEKLQKVIDGAILETAHGKFLGPEGEGLPW